MSVYYARPTSDDKANWTEVPGGSAWSILNASVTEADTPDTSTGYVEAPTTSGDINRQFFTIPKIASTERVIRVDAFWYMRTATTGQTIDVQLLGVGTATGNVVAGTAYGWQSLGILVGFNIPDYVIPADGLAAIRLHAATNGTATAGTARIAEEFLKITTVSQWEPPRMPFV